MADYEPQIPYYTSALERLVAVVRELSKARDMATATAIVRDAARALTGADGATFVLRDGEQCYYADESAIAPLWKGKRFPMAACISGWVMLNGRPAVIEDIYADARIPVEAYRATFVKSLAMVPIRSEAPIGAIGVYWSGTYRLSPQELAVLQALADTTSVTLANLELYATLQQQVGTLERQRTRIRSQHIRLEVFTRALAHDLREPVRTLIGYAGILRDEPGDIENHPTYLSYISNAARRMDILIDAVSRYTRLDDCAQPARILCDLNAIAAGVQVSLGDLLAERGTKLEVGNLPQLDADPAHLMLLLQNLVGNAVLHNSNPVTVSVRHLDSDGHCAIAVADDGVGFDQKQAELIFEPFRRLTHLEERSGLGLAICRRIVALYGGEIKCNAAPGRGATFTFTLPAPEKADRDLVAERRD